MRTLAFYNLKGGVGKTAAAVNVAWCAAKSGLATCLWDLDPQGAASWYLRDTAGLELKAKKLLKDKGALDSQARPTAFSGLDLIPADTTYRHLDLLFEQSDAPREVLAKLVKPLAERYDILVLDCPPSFSRLSENILVLSDVVAVPLIPTPLSMRALAQVSEFLARKGLDRGQLLPFFSMVDKRRQLHRQWLEFPTAAPPNLLKTHVPYASIVEQMGQRQSPLVQFAPVSPAGQAYRSLWDELRQALGLPRPVDGH
ncbi:MAG TPA: ParA family protein [Candidatus Acidoferrales bacterium]|nr:ParA family protein [Candidatus Acidoferrales bacterium]